MQRTYLTQAFTLLKQNRLFSMLYIVGTGLAIAMTVIVAVVYYVKLAPIYPEENRKNTLYLTHVSFKSEQESRTYQSALSYRALQEWIYPLKNVVAVSARFSNAMDYYIQPADRSGDFRPALKLVDPAFFRIYALQFLEGHPFTEADLASGIHTAVISDDLARRLFGTTEGVVGRSFSMDYVNYHVCGVVRGASFLTRQSYAQVYAPYSIESNYKDPVVSSFPYCGLFNVTFLVKDNAQAKALRAEIKDLIRRVNAQYKGQWQMELWEQPTSHALSVFKEYPADTSFSSWKVAGRLTLWVLVLLLVPSLNLNGLIASRMESRLPEMGVRKSFGASRSALLSQVMWENFFLTLVGGLLGLLVAWIMLYVGRGWIFMLFDSWPMDIPEGANLYVSGEMLFAPVVFLIAFLLCLVLNLLSALWPAWMSLRKPIVYSLYEKR
ncbi:ABC transporter permease [Phocaeicola fibrisolvens]|uniref:ABC transporter permease n=1 Tax=Phocaeicola fibrisolvens TaxID=2981793 RepID=UPI0011DCB203|nr:ABC transporter permease [Phocaeicola fibrisolvens]MCU6777400.1 ABC transporter permease [Phocaeicola fibrisolvens]